MTTTVSGEAGTAGSGVVELPGGEGFGAASTTDIQSMKRVLCHGMSSCETQRSPTSLQSLRKVSALTDRARHSSHRVRPLTGYMARFEWCRKACPPGASLSTSWLR